MTIRSILLRGLRFGIRSIEPPTTKSKKRMIPGAICKNFDNVTIGDNVSFGGNVVLSGSAPIDIGHHTMIGADVYIHTSTHDYNNHPMRSQRIDRPVRIGNHVWIGFRAIILCGVIVEDYAVVAAGSVVNAHVPSRAIVAGNPARIISYRETDFEMTDCLKRYSDSDHIITKSFLPDHKQCKAAIE